MGSTAKLPVGKPRLNVMAAVTGPEGVGGSAGEMSRVSPTMRPEPLSVRGGPNRSNCTLEAELIAMQLAIDDGRCAEGQCLGSGDVHARLLQAEDHFHAAHRRRRSATQVPRMSGIWAWARSVQSYTAPASARAGRHSSRIKNGVRAKSIFGIKWATADLARQVAKHQPPEVDLRAGIVDVYAHQISIAVVVQHDTLGNLPALHTVRSDKSMYSESVSAK